MSSPAHLVQYWHEDVVPTDVEAAIATFRQHNSDMSHLLFNESTAEELIATHLADRETAAFRACAVPAMQADYFRYCALLILGGVWADVDLHCKRPLKGLIEMCGGGLMIRPKRTLDRPPPPGIDPTLIPTNNGFFSFPSGHDLLRIVLEVATAHIEQRRFARILAATGPSIIVCLGLIRQFESFDAAREIPIGNGLLRLVDSIARTIGDHERVVRAFDGVRIFPSNRMAKWIGRVTTLRYKQDDTHWINWQVQGRNIYREC